MNFDSEMIKKLSGMDKKELSDKIDEISRMLGIDSRLVRRKLGSPEEIQQKLSNLSDTDIRRITSSIDRDTLAEINKKLGE